MSVPRRLQRNLSCLHHLHARGGDLVERSDHGNKWHHCVDAEQVSTLRVSIIQIADDYKRTLWYLESIPQVTCELSASSMCKWRIRFSYKHTTARTIGEIRESSWTRHSQCKISLASPARSFRKVGPGGRWETAQFLRYMWPIKIMAATYQYIRGTCIDPIVTGPSQISRFPTNDSNDLDRVSNTETDMKWRSVQHKSVRSGIGISIPARVYDQALKLWYILEQRSECIQWQIVGVQAKRWSIAGTGRHVLWAEINGSQNILNDQLFIVANTVPMSLWSFLRTA